MDLNPAVAVIRDAHPDVVAIYVYGSRARGDAQPGSDVDLAILPAAPTNAVGRFGLQERVARALGVDVDLIDLIRASTVLRIEVLRHGVVLHDADPASRALFEATSFGQYARLNLERRGILEDVRARGTTRG